MPTTAVIDRLGPADLSQERATKSVFKNKFWCIDENSQWGEVSASVFYKNPAFFFIA